jgi:CRP/FNR family transcriptional activator FtrB
MSARSISETSLLFVPALRFREALHSDTELAVATAEELSGAFRTMVRQVRWQKLRTAKMRLATYLLLLCEPSRGPTRISLTIPKRLLASMLGLEPESLSRSFTSLSEHGVRVAGDIIDIDDPDALRRIASYDCVIDAAES